MNEIYLIFQFHLCHPPSKSERNETKKKTTQNRKTVYALKSFICVQPTGINKREISENRKKREEEKFCFYIK